MTSLMDLSFLLLITFIITYPALEHGIRVKLPRGRAERIEQAKSQNVTIDIEGQVYLNNRPLDLAELERQLAEMVARDAEVAVLVRGDERLAYSQIVKVLRVLHKARVTRLALVTEPG